MQQLELLPEQVEAPERNPLAALFAPNGHRRCKHCRKRLHAFGGRLLCANPHCTQATR